MRLDEVIKKQSAIAIHHRTLCRGIYYYYTLLVWAAVPFVQQLGCCTRRDIEHQHECARTQIK